MLSSSSPATLMVVMPVVCSRLLNKFKSSFSKLPLALLIETKMMGSEFKTFSDDFGVVSGAGIAGSAVWLSDDK